MSQTQRPPIRRLEATAAALTDTEALARLLLRAESVASSRIEGLEIGPRRLLRAEAALDMGVGASDVGAEEDPGQHRGDGPGPGVLGGCGNHHRRDLDGDSQGASQEHPAAGVRRARAHISELAWWSSYNPCSASYVPPPEEEVPRLLDDLAEFCNSDMLPTVVQAAIVHAQFETIHPFADGNGRTGRALIHLILRRRGLSERVQPPISLILATRAAAYIDGLAGFRYDGPPDSREAHVGLNAWVGFFAAACVRAVDDAMAFEQRCQELENEWRERIGRVRSGSSVDRLLRLLPGTPVLSVNSAMALLGRSKPQVNQAIARLVDAGILVQVNVGRRNRAFEACGVIDAFADLERRLASPIGDTNIAPPVRPVPARRM